MKNPDFQKWLNRCEHEISELSDDQYSMEITTRRPQVFGGIRSFKTEIKVTFKALDGNCGSFEVGDQVLLESLDTESNTISIRPKESRLPSFIGILLRNEND